MIGRLLVVAFLLASFSALSAAQAPPAKEPQAAPAPKGEPSAAKKDVRKRSSVTVSGKGQTRPRRGTRRR